LSDQASYYGFSTISLEHAGAWITFTTSFLHQMNSRPLAGLIRRYGNFNTDPGGASWHIGAEAWSLLFLLFLSCWAAQSSCVLLCSQPCPSTGSVTATIIKSPSSSPAPSGTQNILAEANGESGRDLGATDTREATCQLCTISLSVTCNGKQD